MVCVRQAKDAVKEAQRSDPDSIFTQFSVYKVAVLENNVEEGIWDVFMTRLFTCVSIKALPCCSCRGSEGDGTSGPSSGVHRGQTTGA